MGITMKNNQHAREMSKRMGDKEHMKEQRAQLKELHKMLTPRRPERNHWQPRPQMNVEYINGRPVRVRRNWAYEQERTAQQRHAIRKQRATTFLAGAITLPFIALFSILAILFNLARFVVGVAVIWFAVADMVNHHSVNNGWAWFWILLGVVLIFWRKK